MEQLRKNYTNDQLEVLRRIAERGLKLAQAEDKKFIDIFSTSIRRDRKDKERIMSEAVKKQYITFEQTKGHVLEITRQMHKDKWEPELIIGITRGGALPAVMLSQFLNVKMIGMDISLRDSAEYGPEHNAWAAELAQNGKRILIVDDINDTGSTIAWIKKDWDYGREKIVWGDNVRFAVLVDNESSKETVDYSSLNINKAFEDVWLVFPWEDFWK
jgi:hypoxanthine phosphoribosyltransferase